MLHSDEHWDAWNDGAAARALGLNDQPPEGMRAELVPLWREGWKEEDERQKRRAEGTP